MQTAATRKAGSVRRYKLVLHAKRGSRMYPPRDETYNRHGARWEAARHIRYARKVGYGVRALVRGESWQVDAPQPQHSGIMSISHWKRS